MFRRLILPLLGVLTLCLAVAPPASAIGAFGTPRTVVDPGCGPDVAASDFVQDTSGRSRGFVNLFGSDCNAAQKITYVSGLNGTWSRQATPYRGFPVASAWDSTGTYLLYVGYPTLGLYVTKRYSNGSFGTPRLLSSRVGPDGSLLSGDLVARNGRWWAVWREHVSGTGTPGDEFAQTELFQAHTFDGVFHGRTRITANPRWDGAPSLALTPGTGYPVRLVWTRGDSDFGGAAGTDLWLATSTAAGVWTSAPFATVGTNNFWPDVAVVGSSVLVAWNRDGRILAASRTGSATMTKSFAVPGLQHVRPRLAAFGGVVAVAWTGTGYRSYVAERVGSTWSGTYATPVTPGIQHLVGVATSGGRSTAISMFHGSRLVSTTEN